MICYKDKTFCKAWKQCKEGDSCPLALTKEVIEDAKRWWGTQNPPIACTEIRDCFERRK